MLVYLAGGMTSGWQEKVKLSAPDFKYVDVCFRDAKMKNDNLKPKIVEEYTQWDKHWVKNCDILFAYMEDDNPSGFGMACELSYAHRLGKTCILVLEPNSKCHKDRYLKFMNGFSDITFDNLDDGINYLKILLWTN